MTFSIPPLLTVVAVSGISLALGFQLGSRPQPPSKNPTDAGPEIALVEAPSDSESEDDGSEDEEDVADGDLSLVQAGIMEQCKLVLIVRTDLKMSSGKIAAQCGHATLACYKAMVQKNAKLVQHWERTGQAKIALKATSEDQLLELEAIAKSLNLCARSIQDAGRTEVEAGTRTVLGIGPAPIALINQVTGKLRLL